MLLQRMTNFKLLLLLSLLADISCRPLPQDSVERVVRDAGKDQSKPGKDGSSLPKDDTVKKDEEIIMRFEGDILIPLSEWQSLTQDGFGDSDYEPDPYMDDDYEDSKFGGYEDSRLHRREAKEQSDTEQLTTMTSTTMTSTTAESPTTTSSTASVTTQRVKATHSPTPTVNAKLWPNCRVPYKFDHNLDTPTRMKYMMAMEMWKNAIGCIEFEYALLDDIDYLYLTKGETCSSFVGRRGGGPQAVTIADDCSEIGNFAHEIGHAIGLWHEHSRPDRDDYIHIHHNNILRDDFKHFEVVKPEIFKQVPDVGYDIQSVMHYGPYFFSYTGNRTITIKEDADLPELECTNTLPMGQRETLSFLDKKRASLLYNCEFNLEAPECIRPSPTTPPPATTTPPTTMPTPSTTTQAPTAPPLDVKLKSGNVIALTFGIGDNQHGIQCVPSPGCTPIPCEDFLGNSCEAHTNQFQILDQAGTSKIRSGSTILLRSVRTPSHWLDCSDPTQCVISACKEDNEEDPGNSSYISNCSKHHFEVFGHNRALNKLLNVNHKLYFKKNDSYLNCNGNRCGLLETDSCPNESRALYPVSPENGKCPAERYNVIKLSEI